MRICQTPASGRRESHMAGADVTFWKEGMDIKSPSTSTKAPLNRQRPTGRNRGGEIGDIRIGREGRDREYRTGGGLSRRSNTPGVAWLTGRGGSSSHLQRWGFRPPSCQKQPATQQRCPVDGNYHGKSSGDNVEAQDVELGVTLEPWARMGSPYSCL